MIEIPSPVLHHLDHARRKVWRKLNWETFGAGVLPYSPSTGEYIAIRREFGPQKGLLELAGGGLSIIAQAKERWLAPTGRVHNYRAYLDKSFKELTEEMPAFPLQAITKLEHLEDSFDERGDSRDLFVVLGAQIINTSEIFEQIDATPEGTPELHSIHEDLGTSEMHHGLQAGIAILRSRK